MLSTVLPNDEFGGAAVSSSGDNRWPFNRATLEISTDAIACARPSGGRSAHQATDGSSVTVTHYRYFPFCVRTIVWIDRTSRAGFQPYRWRAVRDSLIRHRWHVNVERKSWLTVVADVRAAWRSDTETGELPTT